MRSWHAILVLLAAGCYGGAMPHARSSQVTAEYRGAPQACGRARSYAPRLTPREASPGTRVTVAGRFPQYGENGKPGAPTTKLAVWWNLRPERYDTAVSAHPLPDRRGRVLELGAVRVPVPNPCGYRISFRIPDVSPSSYRVVLLGFGGGGFAAFAPVRLTVG